MKKFLFMVFAVITLIFGAGQAFAATTSTNFNVYIGVQTPCSISANYLNFGNYTSVQTFPLYGSTTVNVQCNTDVSYSVELNGGMYGASYSTRQAFNSVASSYIPYYLYRDVVYSMPWGTIVEGYAYSGLGDGTLQYLNVYATVPAYLTPVAGSYNDTVTATIYW